MNVADESIAKKAVACLANVAVGKVPLIMPLEE
jgi:hypothetical protein